MTKSVNIKMAKYLYYVMKNINYKYVLNKEICFFFKLYKLKYYQIDLRKSLKFYRTYIIKCKPNTHNV